MVRIFNTYGPRMRLNDGRVVPAFMGQALRGEDLTIFGKGDQTRSFCYVDDLVEGIYRLLLSDYAGPVNIGNPKEITIKQFAQEILKLTGTKQKLIYKPLPSDDPMQRQPDITLAKKLLKWQPKVDRAEGMKRTFEYFKALTQGRAEREGALQFREVRAEVSEERPLTRIRASRCSRTLQPALDACFGASRLRACRSGYAVAHRAGRNRGHVWPAR